jgi:phage terminase large subunit-like protein
MRTIRRKIRLHSVQHAFRHSPALFRAFVGGRSAGKSWVGIYDLIRRARPGRTYTAADPTSIMSRDDTFPRFQKMAREMGVWRSMRLTPYPDVTLVNGAVVRFRTAEDPEKMRGPDIAGFWLNEASLMHRDAFLIAIGCLREGGEQGWLSATFTPAGPTHWSYEEFATEKPNTALFRAPTRANPFNPPGFAETLAGQYGDSQWARQELGGEFVQMEGATFPAHWFDGILVPEWPATGIAKQVLYLDPSQGKDSKAGDAQAYCRAGFWSGPRNQNLIFLEATVTKEPPPEMVARGVAMCRARRPDLLAYEVNATMGFLSAEFDRQFAEAKYLLRTWPHTNTEPKLFRIRNALMPYLAQKRVRIVDNPGGRVLRAELQSHPFGEHDDAADAAAGSVAFLERLVNGG